MGDFEKWIKSVPTKQPSSAMDERLNRLIEDAEWNVRRQRRFFRPLSLGFAACAVCIVIGYNLGRSENESSIRQQASWDTETATYYVIDIGSDANRNLFDSPSSEHSFLSGKTKIVIIDDYEDPQVIQSNKKPGNPS
jgi:hypothetical protein